ncbi:MAG TPA: transposase [Anaerolineae bacterium]|nr:transposase [Anaerolineae bacterium]
MGSPLHRIVQWFKTMTTNEYIKQIKKGMLAPFLGKLWQRNYYEHIIHNNDELNKIREYIQNNSLKWEFDIENPQRICIDELENVIFKYTENK